MATGPFTTAHLMRWSAAMENWHKIHYDLPFATEHDKLPGLLINGSLKQQFLAQSLKDWAGPTVWVMMLILAVYRASTTWPGFAIVAAAD